MEQYAIIDKNGVVYQGGYDFIQKEWAKMVYEDNSDNVKWEGDLMLINIMEIVR